MIMMVAMLCNWLGMDWTTTVLIVAFIAILLYLWRNQKPDKFPPGPLGLPYLGSMIDLVQTFPKDTYTDYMEALHSKYGKIAGIRTGAINFIFMNDGPQLANLFRSEEFGSRPTSTFAVFKKLTKDGKGDSAGIFFGNGEPHKEMRKFTLLSLRDFGVGKKSVDEMIQTEITILCQNLEAMSKIGDGTITGIKATMQYATANVIHHIVFGFRNEYDDPEWRKLLQTLYDFFSINPLSFPENFLPIIDKIPYLAEIVSGKKKQKFFKIHDVLREYVNKQIDNHRATYEEGEIRDFIDLYIKYESRNEKYYTNENVFQTILDLFRAGTDTTASTVTWAVWYLLKEPSIQEELRAEVDEVVGGRPYVKSDREKLVKVTAFINELHRKESLAQSTPPRTVENAVEIDGYLIRPGDMVTGSLHSIHHNKDYWGDPENFRISRWIGDNGELLNHKGHFFPFSVGLRKCPGSQLANTEVTVILTQFLQNFTFQTIPGKDDFTRKGIAGVVRSPAQFEFKIKRRA